MPTWVGARSLTSSGAEVSLSSVSPSGGNGTVRPPGRRVPRVSATHTHPIWKSQALVDFALYHSERIQESVFQEAPKSPNQGGWFAPTQ